jgi:ankyrin repeat protein
MIREERIPILVVLGAVWCFAQSFAVAQETPLHKAAAAGDKALVARLLDEGADINSREGQFERTPLFFAVGNGHKEVVELLINRGADVNARDIGKLSMTPLHLALSCSSYTKEVVELLLAKGADIKAKDGIGQTALMVAVGGRGGIEVVDVLLNKGADINERNIRGETVLHWATLGGKIEVVEFLLRRGAEVNAKTNYGETSLDIARSDEMKVLLRKFGGK